jgi:hypothetical protein
MKNHYHLYMFNYEHYFFTFLCVSKSLLIVLGTLPIPAIMAVESTALREFQCIPAKACKTSGFPSFPQLVISNMTNSLSCLIFEPSYTAGSADKARTSRFFITVWKILVYIQILFPFFLLILPCSGLPLSRLMFENSFPLS